MARKQQPGETDITRPAVTGRPDQSRMRRVAQAQENAPSQRHANRLLQALEGIR